MNSLVSSRTLGPLLFLTSWRVWFWRSGNLPVSRLNWQQWSRYKIKIYLYDIALTLSHWRIFHWAWHLVYISLRKSLLYIYFIYINILFLWLVGHGRLKRKTGTEEEEGMFDFLMELIINLFLMVWAILIFIILYLYPLNRTLHHPNLERHFFIKDFFMINH